MPLLVVEVASVSTVHGDREGKRAAYARLGVAEYLIFDPTGGMRGQRGRYVEAWRLESAEARTYEPWPPDARGEWVSALGVALHPDPPFLDVRDGQGEIILRLLAQQQARLAEQAARLAAEARAEAEQVARLAAEARAEALEERMRALEEALRRARQDGEPS